MKHKHTIICEDFDSNRWCSRLEFDCFKVSLDGSNAIWVGVFPRGLPPLPGQ